MDPTANIRRLLDRCEEYVRELREMQGPTQAEFQASRRLQWQVERGLQLATQASIDISDDVLFQLGLPEPDTAADTFRALHDAGVIEADLARELIAAARFGNVLVHDYADLDLSGVYRRWHQDLDHYEAFCRAVRAHLEGQQ